ncbi:NAD(P)-dependent alcohol dehydrogenase [Mycoplasmatota bacterium]|nr:NAD(P)-dependent alcohol dehydrogenase [Mycoplasmatota bacterium]
MKAVTQYKYGGVDKLYLEDADKPIIKDDEILIEVFAANVSSGDMKINTLDIHVLLRPMIRLVFGLFGPRKKIRGISGAGRVIKVGSRVTKYKKGDRVNYINSMNAGCIAEYISLKEKSVMATFNENIDDVNAAPIAFGAMTALHFINESTVKTGDKILIYGASGSVGTYAVQLAKYYGAHVTAVSSKINHKILKSIGADDVIDYQTEDIRKNNQSYDLIFDAVMKISKKQIKTILTKNGTFLSVKSMTKELSTRIEYLNALLSDQKLTTVLDHVYELSEFKEAFVHVYSKHKVGNVVIKVK